MKPDDTNIKPAICPAPLTQSIERVLKDIHNMTKDESTEIQPVKLDGFARSISTHIKALEDLEKYNAAAAKAANEKAYSTYEDIPPPSPADRKRFYIRLKSLIRDVEDGTLKEADVDELPIEYN